MFGSVLGHERARRLLEAAVRSGRPAHAYLLTGPEGVGKLALARAFAAALNCTAPLDERPCGQCRPCRLHASGGHPDYREIDRTTGSDERRSRVQRNIPIEAIRALQHDAGLTSHLGGHKVYVIVEAERLSLQAMDALLKTLEEPAPRVVIVLTCVDAGLLPLTVVSRCQVVKLGLVPAETIAPALAERSGIDSDRAEVVARLAAGRPGAAFGMVADRDALADREAALAELIGLDLASRTERLRQAEKMSQEHGKRPESTARNLELLLAWWRDLLLVRTGCDELVVNRDRLETLRARAQRLSLAEIRDALRAIEQTTQYLSENVQPRIALELLALSLPRPV